MFSSISFSVFDLLLITIWLPFDHVFLGKSEVLGFDLLPAAVLSELRRCSEDLNLKIKKSRITITGRV
jgi:hypothetical protein